MFLNYLDKTVKEAIDEIINTFAVDEEIAEEKLDFILKTLVKKNVAKSLSDFDPFGRTDFNDWFNN